MRADSGTRWAGRVRLVRVIALFLLAYSFADILCPQYCCEEMLGLYSAGSIIQVGEDPGIPAVSNSQDSRSGQKSGAIPGDEDCFCRSPVLPSLAQSADMSGSHAIVAAPVPSYILPLPPTSGEAHLTFHAPPGSPPSPLLLNKSIRC